MFWQQKWAFLRQVISPHLFKPECAPMQQPMSKPRVMAPVPEASDPNPPTLMV